MNDALGLGLALALIGFILLVLAWIILFPLVVLAVWIETKITRSRD